MTQYLMELERLISVYWNEDDLHTTIDQYVHLVTTVEPDSEVYSELIGEFKEWIDGRTDTIESYIQSGGVEGIPGPMECYGEDETEGLNEVGELVTAASHSCAHTSSPAHTVWLFSLVLLLVHRRKPHSS